MSKTNVPNFKSVAQSKLYRLTYVRRRMGSCVLGRLYHYVYRVEVGCVCINYITYMKILPLLLCLSVPL